MAFSWIDLAVVIAYVIAITAFGARFRKKGQRSLHDYFLGGNRLPWWAITLSIVCAETSILTIISTPGIAYHSNLGFLQLVLGYLVARVVVSFLLIPRYFAGELYTAYELIERRFGHGLRLFTAGLFLLTRALAEGVRVFAISLVIAIIFKTGVAASLAIIFVLTLFYTLEGGLAAVIWTDVIQLTIYVSGTVVALFVALHHIPGGWGEVVRVAQAAGGKFTIFNFHFDWSQPYLFWTGLVGGMFLNTASHGTDQLIVQQLLAARNRRQSQGALLASGIVVLLQFSLFPRNPPALQQPGKSRGRRKRRRARGGAGAVPGSRDRHARGVSPHQEGKDGAPAGRVLGGRSHVERKWRRRAITTRCGGAGCGWRCRLPFTCCCPRAITTGMEWRLPSTSRSNSRSAIPRTRII